MDYEDSTDNFLAEKEIDNLIDGAINGSESECVLVPAMAGTISGEAIKVWAHLQIEVYQKYKKCPVFINTIVTKSGYSRNKVVEAIQQLIDNKYLRIVKDDLGAIHCTFLIQLN